MASGRDDRFAFKLSANKSYLKLVSILGPARSKDPIGFDLFKINAFAKARHSRWHGLARELVINRLVFANLCCPEACALRKTVRRSVSKDRTQRLFLETQSIGKVKGRLGIVSHW